MELEDISIMAWLEKYQLKTETGQAIEFVQHPFLFDIYRDMSPCQVVLKAAQVGLSTLQVLKTLWVAKKKGLDVLYTLPADSDVIDFVGGKVNRIIGNNEVLRSWTADRDTVEQKQIGKNILYYRGTFIKKAAMMVSGDLLVHDEVDASKQDVLADYESRLQHSKWKWRWYFSHPSVAGYGVSVYWEKSDQKKWNIVCGGCRAKQVLTWPESVDREKKEYVCKSCKKVLTDEERRVGEWVAEREGAEFSGYWINLMMCSWVSAKEVCRYAEEKSAQYFYNRVLGLPYVGESNTVTPDMIFRNCTSRVNSQERVVIGCDSGLKKHYVVGNEEGLFYYGVASKWEEVEGLLKRFEGSVAVIDALPDLTAPRELRERYPGRVYLASYVRDRKGMEMVRWGREKEAGSVLVDRNRALQMLIDEFAERRVPLQGTAEDWREFYGQWKSLYKVSEVDALGIPQFKWESSDGNDHWAHASLYWRVGMERFGGGKAEMFGVGSLLSEVREAPVMTRDGRILLSDPRKVFQFEEKNNDWRNEY